LGIYGGKRMTHRKQIKRLEELMTSLRDVQIDMANEGMLIEGYDRTVDNLQKKYHSLTGGYFHLEPPYAVRVPGLEEK
jgi:hypothetical protein